MFPQIFGKYVLEREIAAGGMARVYLATLRGAVGFEKRLVVKQIRAELASDDAFVTRFVEEAKTAVELSHPNIVPVYELGVEQGVYYIAMELCEGLTLSEVLAETGPLGPSEGAYVGAEICRALDYAHRRARIVHRDVTPRNVLIDDEGGVRLIDFGIAAPVTRAENAARSEVFGSPGHMPPEQLAGAELTPATDVFAVGALLIEAWTGYPPFRRGTAHESELALGSVPAAIDAQQPLLAPLSALIASSVALDARQRPVAAEHMARPLREFLKSEDSGDIARRLGDRVRRARRSLRSSSPWLLGEPGTGESRANTQRVATAPVTRTFAARDEVEIWTRKLSSQPAPPSHADDSVREPSGISSSKVSGAPKRKTGWLAFAVLAGFVGLALVLTREPGVPRARAVHAAVGVPAPKPSVTSAEPMLALAPAPRSSPVAPAAIPKAAEIPRVRAFTANAAPSAEASQFGTLKITADPRSAVEVSGPHFQQSGQSPLVGLKLPVGKYQVVFRNDTFGAPLSAQLTILSGVSRSIHADFRQAEPAISVH